MRKKAIEKYATYEFNWYYVEKTKKILPLLISDNKVINLIDNTCFDIDGLISKDELLKVFEENYGKGTIYYIGRDFIYNILNKKERSLFPGDADRNGLLFCKYSRKDIIKMAKVFSNAINRCKKESEAVPEMEF